MGLRHMRLRPLPREESLRRQTHVPEARATLCVMRDVVQPNEFRLGWADKFEVIYAGEILGKSLTISSDIHS